MIPSFFSHHPQQTDGIQVQLQDLSFSRRNNPEDTILQVQLPLQLPNSCI
jgi:hypothetical protein